MAGKRPDQHNIDPGEGGATDYKNLPQTGRGTSSLDDTVELDRQRLAKDRESHAGPFKPDRPAPSKHANAGRPIEEEMSGREREAEGTEDPRERGVGG